MLDQPYMTDLIEANSMGHEPNLIDIYSASWGPTDDGKTVDGPRNATMRAIVRGVNEVRFVILHDLFNCVHNCNFTLLHCFERPIECQDGIVHRIHERMYITLRAANLTEENPCGSMFQLPTKM
jgi:hypothetical protein